MYGPNVMSIQMVCKWVREFFGGRTIVQNILNGDRHLTFDEMLLIHQEQHFVGILRGTLHTILHDSLDLTKVCAQ